MLQLIAQLLALLLTELLALAEFKLLAAQVLNARLFGCEPLILLLVLCLRNNVLCLEIALDFFSSKFLGVGLVHGLLERVCFTSKAIYL